MLGTGLGNDCDFNDILEIQKRINELKNVPLLHLCQSKRGKPRSTERVLDMGL